MVARDAKAMDSRRGQACLIMRLGCLISWITILTAGLWPLNFAPKNGVSWSSGNSGIEFDGHGMAVGNFPLAAPRHEAGEFAAFTLEIRVRPAEVPRGGMPRIFSLYDGQAVESFFIGQWKSELVIRNRVAGPNPSGRYREVGLESVFLKDRDVFITVTSERAGTGIFVDGRPGQFFRNYSLNSGEGPDPALMILGDNPGGMSGFKGIISGLAVYGRALAEAEVEKNFEQWERTGTPVREGGPSPAALYLFDERAGRVVRNLLKPKDYIEIPEVFRPLRRTVLSLDQRRIGWSWSFGSDAGLNVLGFVPFVFFQGAVLFCAGKLGRLRVYALTFIVGAGTSLMIELVQAYLPTRHSDLADLACNILGSALGLLLLYCLDRNLDAACGRSQR